jgi:2-polyprenyl-3-methyl-5-hydroxy-6-metoxy-1,4-benzoquinol methylase
VREADIEKEPLPYPDHTFDALVFTEVLEHVAIKSPAELLQEFRRVLLPGGILIFSTPNVCNLSNVIALLRGKNIFWPMEMFYGSLDRHNREWTPGEVELLFQDAGFEMISMWGMCDHSNWRMGAADAIYDRYAALVDQFAMMRNTIVGVFRSPSVLQLASEEADASS